MGLDNLIFNTRFLPLLALGIFLPRECGNFNTFLKACAVFMALPLHRYILENVLTVFLLYLCNDTFI